MGDGDAGCHAPKKKIGSVLYATFDRDELDAERGGNAGVWLYLFPLVTLELLTHHLL